METTFSEPVLTERRYCPGCPHEYDPDPDSEVVVDVHICRDCRFYRRAERNGKSAIVDLGRLPHDHIAQRVGMAAKPTSDWGMGCALADSPNVAPDIQWKVARSKSVEMRQGLARSRAIATFEGVQRILMKDPEDVVRSELARNPALCPAVLHDFHKRELGIIAAGNCDGNIFVHLHSRVTGTKCLCNHCEEEPPDW